ncbi:MAG: hypothetical protein HDT05_00120 [Bacteroidales bacterium]|nr:hypothetical protein [Bacteroidales bacterium]
MKQNLLLSLIFLIEAIAAQSLHGASYVLPTEADFPFSDDCQIYKSDFPLHIVFDKIPSQPVVVTYSSNGSQDLSIDRMEVDYQVKKYYLDSPELVIQWDESLYGKLNDGKYNVDMNIGFLDENDYMILKSAKEPYSFNCFYTISPNVHNGEDCIITYANYIADSSSERENIGLEPKNVRLKSSSGVITATYNAEDFPVSIEKCIEYAQSIWESVLPSDVDLKIEYALQVEDIPLKVDVAYSQMGTEQYYYPSSLKFYLLSHDNMDGFDGKIIINPIFDWDTNVGLDISQNKYNLTSALVKAIGRILGLGSSLKVNTDGSYTKALSRSYFTKFDSMIRRSDGRTLTEFPMSNSAGKAAAKEFINEEGYYFYVINDTPGLRLEEGPYTIENPPLTQMKEGLMSGSLTPGSYNLSVDENTINILQEIGWNTEYSEYSIENYDLTLEGIESNGTEYVYLTGDTSQVSNIKWICTLPLANGDYESIVLSNDPVGKNPPRDIVATLPNDLSSDKYKVSVDGLIRGIVRCQYSLNGKQQQTAPYSFYHSTEPKVVYAKVIEKSGNLNDDLYDLRYEVVYYGGEQLEIEYEIENYPMTVTSFINEPYCYQGEIRQIPRSSAVDLTFTIKDSNNDSKPYTLHVPAESSVYGRPLDMTEIKDTSCDSSYTDSWTAYNIMGMPIWSGSDLNEFRNKGYKGIYLLCLGSTNSKEQKILKVIF